MNKKNTTTQVKDVMTKSVITIRIDDTVLKAKELMRDKGISGIPVVDNQQFLLGIISIADLIDALENNDLHSAVKNYMSPRVISLGWNATVGQALKAFRENRFGRFPVVDEKGKVVGILTQGDVATRLASILGIDSVETEGEVKVQDEILPILKRDSLPQTFQHKIIYGDFERTGEGASSLKGILTWLGVSRGIVRRSAIAVYEAEMNVMLHANGGRIEAVITTEEITIVVEDKGPGIPDLNQAMQKGFSTASNEARRMGFGAGMGLPNIKKSADTFHIESSPKGTKLIVKILLTEGTLTP